MADIPDTVPGSSPTTPESPPLIVGLGASAGGIAALKEFFARVQPGGGAAFVVILHLSPSYDSRLAEVLQMTAALPVMQVTDETRIEADSVYVIPPNRLLEVVDGTLTLRKYTRAEQRRSPVDVFFRALADSQGSRSVCVVLSGTGSNGSAGLKHVKEYGGLAIAQDPAQAEYGEMPQNAIATGLVDLVLPVEEMPSRIRAYHDRLRRGAPDDGVATADAAPADDVLREILTLLRMRTGHDFSNYKPGTLKRRIERRIHLKELPSAAAYARAIRESPDEAMALMKELLISVTSFYRDPEAFKALSVRAIPRLFTDKRSTDQVRAWVPACATGEEAYSIAMLLAEYGATRTEAPAIQVFATDLDQEAIATARDGLYSEADIKDMCPEQLQRFFQREAGGYRVRRGLREMVLFAHHNVLKDPPFSHLDLISCRNLLIYLNRAVQERVLDTFHFALRPGGYLFLGGAESAEDVTNQFVAVDKGSHLYEVRSVMARRPLPAAGLDVPNVAIPLKLPETRQERISAGELHQRLLEQYGPPSLVVTEQHMVMHMSDRVGRYLQVPGGEPTRDLFQLVLRDLRPSLRAALQEAVRGSAPVEVRAVPVTFEDRVRGVDISIRPALRQSDPARGLFLIAFSEEEESSSDGAAVQVFGPSDPAASRLEEEVARLQLQLRGTIEQYETQAEEAKAANEELQALNEELRSAAEELETSKEELQSVNEELTTVNQELKIKIEELGQANNDYQNLINSTDLGTIFLDRSLRVMMSTPAAREVFNLRERDMGRPLSDITTQLRDHGLDVDIRQVLEKLHTTDREVQTRDGRWYLMRLRPYRTTDDRIEGVVITFQDITHRRRTELRVRQSEERLRLLIDAVVDYAMFTMALDGVIDSWNSGAERMFGYEADEVIGQHVGILFTPDDRMMGTPDEELGRARRDGRVSDDRLHMRKDGTLLHCTGVTTVLQAGGEVVGFAKIARDLSEFKNASAAVNAARTELEAVIRDRTGHLKAEVHQHAAGQTRVLRLLRRIVTAQEDERARIARDLHDQLGQQLTALRLALEQHRNQLAAAGAVPPEVDRALALTHGIDKEVDFLAWELRPAVLDDLGLGAALPKFVREWSQHYGIVAEYRVHGFESGDVSRETEVVFYRVTQEALNNVVKHAHASRVDVILEVRNATLMLVIEDDGVGFEPADPQLRDRGIGLVGMRERAEAIGGSLQVESAPGEGTSLFLRCPVAAISERAAT